MNNDKAEEFENRVTVDNLNKWLTSGPLATFASAAGNGRLKKLQVGVYVGLVGNLQIKFIVTNNKEEVYSGPSASIAIEKYRELP